MISNRRAFLATLFAATTFGFASQSGVLKFHGHPPVNILMPQITPGASWTGVASSGWPGGVGKPDPVTGTETASPTRTAPMPTVRWWTEKGQRIAGSEFVIGVEAAAMGDVARIEFVAEGGVVATVSTKSVYTDLNANGQPRSRYGFWAKVSIPAFRAQSVAAGVVGVGDTQAIFFARAVPNNPAFQTRTSEPLNLWIEDTLFDFDVTVKPSGGGNYTTLQAAIEAARTGAKKSTRIRLMDSGFYELVNGTQYSGHRGWTVITHAPGVTATLGRAVFPTSSNSFFTNWFPGPQACEFRGAGLTFDMSNMLSVANSLGTNYDGGNWYNGVNVIYPPGSRSYTWQGGPRPNAFALGRGYITDCTIQGINSPINMQWKASGNRIDDTLNDVATGTPFIADNFINHFNASDEFNPTRSVVTTTYSGSATTATLQKSSGVYTMREDGVVVGTFSDTANAYTHVTNNATLSGGTILTWAEFKRVVELQPGWAVTIIDGRLSTGWRTGVAATSVMGAGLTYTISLNLTHQDFWQSTGGPPQGQRFRENIICVRNTVPNMASNGIEGIFNGGNSPEPMVDYQIEDNYWRYSSLGYDALVNSHFMVRNSVFGTLDIYGIPNVVEIVNSVFDWRPQNGVGNAGNSVISNCIVGYNGAAPTGMTNCILVPNAGPGTSTLDYYVSRVAGDIRPAPGSTMATNLRPAITGYDAWMTPRAAMDAIGPISLNAVAPNWPFSPTSTP